MCKCLHKYIRTFAPTYMAKETYNMAKETYNMAKETYSYTDKT